jgi:hypothetical protein
MIINFGILGFYVVIKSMHVIISIECAGYIRLLS